jgi:DNA integrity scanning protein DisA with diadenylate cyclase activity
MLINAIAALRRASPWQRTGLSPLEVPLYKLKFTIFITLPLVIAKPARDYSWLRHHKSAMAVTQHLARLLEIALHFAREGREGSSIGAIFVLGDRRTLSPHLRQLILNPLQGHAQAARSIHNPDFLETLRELAAMDGAFVVNRRGVVDSAGTYLDAPVGRGSLRPGLGARHAAALAIPTVTDATAVVISASSGTNLGV